MSENKIIQFPGKKPDKKPSPNSHGVGEVISFDQIKKQSEWEKIITKSVGNFVEYILQDKYKEAGDVKVVAYKYFATETSIDDSTFNSFWNQLVESSIYKREIDVGVFSKHLDGYSKYIDALEGSLLLRKLKDTIVTEEIAKDIYITLQTDNLFLKDINFDSFASKMKKYFFMLHNNLDRRSLLRSLSGGLGGGLVGELFSSFLTGSSDKKNLGSENSTQSQTKTYGFGLGFLLGLAIVGGSESKFLKDYQKELKDKSSFFEEFIDSIEDTPDQTIRLLILLNFLEKDFIKISK